MKEFELAPGEHVVKEARKHWFFFVAELLPFAIITVLPFIIPKLLPLIPPLAQYAGLFDYSGPVARAVLGIFLLLIWTTAWSTFTKHFLNLWVLTNQRIVAIKQRGYFRREVSSLFLARVQDVTTNVNGVLSSLLNMGDITVQSAGAVDEFHMYGIAFPEQMRNMILRYVGDEHKEGKAV